MSVTQFAQLKKNISYGYTKLETPVPVRTLKISTWMGDHSRVRRGCCSKKYSNIPEAEKWAPSITCL